MIQQLSLKKPALESIGRRRSNRGVEDQAPNRLGRWVLLGREAWPLSSSAGCWWRPRMPRLRHERELEAAAARSASDPPSVSVAIARRPRRPRS